MIMQREHFRFLFVYSRMQFWLYFHITKMLIKVFSPKTKDQSVLKGKLCFFRNRKAAGSFRIAVYLHFQLEGFQNVGLQFGSANQIFSCVYHLTLQLQFKESML